MNKRQKLIFELFLIFITGVLGIFMVPAMITERDTLSAMAGSLLAFFWLVWVVIYLCRLFKIK